MTRQRRRAALISFTLEQLVEAAANDEGFCTACGTVNECIEPDAREYTCQEPQCRAPRVFGAEELVLMGLVR